jgi:hypothetical protein
VTFAPKALDAVHRLSTGVPRLINLICDRALLAAYSLRANRIAPEMVERAAESLDLPRSGGSRLGWSRRLSILAPAAVVLLASMLAVASMTYLYERFANGTVHAAAAPQTILVGSFPASDAAGVRALGEWLQASGFQASRVEVDLGPRGRWQRVLAGTYTDPEAAARDAARLNEAAPGLDARVLNAALASNIAISVSHEP